MNTHGTMTAEGEITHRNYKMTAYPFNVVRLPVKLAFDGTPKLIDGAKHFPPARNKDGLLIWALPAGGEVSFSTGQN